MTGYEHCPSLLTERLLLSTYRYIIMAPHDRRFSALCPDGICGMLRPVCRRRACITRITKACCKEGRRSSTSSPLAGKGNNICVLWNT